MYYATVPVGSQANQWLLDAHYMAIFVDTEYEKLSSYRKEAGASYLPRAK